MELQSGAMHLSWLKGCRNVMKVKAEAMCVEFGNLWDSEGIFSWSCIGMCLR